MSKFNTVDNRRIDLEAAYGYRRPAPAVQQPLGAPAAQTARQPDRYFHLGKSITVKIEGGAPVITPTHERGAGYTRTPQADLFFLAVTNMVGEDTFYESATARDARFGRLLAQNAVTDPAWTAGLIGWLRTVGNMRTAAVAAAADYAHVLSATGTPRPTGDASIRTVVDRALQRADEPGEFIAYWHANYGRNTMPIAVKRGLADAILRLYTPHAVLKYDTASHPYRFGDVLQLVQPRAVLSGQVAKQAAANALSYLIDRRYDRDMRKHPVPAMHDTNTLLRGLAAKDPVWLKNTDLLRNAGMTWEDVLSLVGDRMPKKDLWESLIPTMGMMALARNLRNFDQAGVSDAAAAVVMARFSDRDQVVRSRMFPYRWYAAYQAASPRWHPSLGAGLRASTGVIPQLPGRTLAVIDSSGSMGMTMSSKSQITRVEAAAVFAYALAARQRDVNIFGFADHAYHVGQPAGPDVLGNIAGFQSTIGYAGHGTRIAESLQQAWSAGSDRYDRVFLFTDMQTSTNAIGNAIPADVPLYGFNLAGYQASGIDTTRPNRVELGGLTDAVFEAIPLLERGADAAWPWEQVRA